MGCTSFASDDSIKLQLSCSMPWYPFYARLLNKAIMIPVTRACHPIIIAYTFPPILSFGNNDDPSMPLYMILQSNHKRVMASGIAGTSFGLSDKTNIEEPQYRWISLPKFQKCVELGCNRVQVSYPRVSWIIAVSHLDDLALSNGWHTMPPSVTLITWETFE